MANLPEQQVDSELDDTQGVDVDLESLFNKYILPIDRVRSFAAAPMVDRPVIADGNSVANDAANAADIDPSSPQESRAHAFYRMIGLPVVNEQLQFYNPGFDPTLKADQRKKNYDISTKVSTVVKDLQTQRETSVRGRLAVFRRLSIDACIHAIAMGVPTGVKPFLQMDDTENFDFINEKDEQKFNLPERQRYIESRYEGRDLGDGVSLAISNFFDEGTHILRPFTVDPNITDTVTGFANETRKVAAPFLPTRGDTGIEREVFTKRPGIEFILRLRIKEQTSNIEDALALVLEDVGDESTDLTEVVSALLNKAGSEVTSDDILERLKNSTRMQFVNINKLVKTIKAVVEELVVAVDTITNVSKKIKWTPLPSEIGPEGGSDVTNLVVPLQKTALERRINNLEVRAIQSRDIGVASDDFNNSEFQMAQFENTEKVWQQELDDARECRDNQQKRGSDALAAIEAITGEISGLGLIDVLAIYTALWAIDIEVLISMLDENAFDRMYVFNTDLRSEEVESRRTGGPQMSVVEAIQAFEGQVINILSYADKIFQDRLGAPQNGEGGSIPQDS